MQQARGAAPNRRLRAPAGYRHGQLKQRGREGRPHCLPAQRRSVLRSAARPAEALPRRGRRLAQAGRQPGRGRAPRRGAPEHASDDVAQVRHVVHVRQGRGDQDVALPRDRQPGAGRPELGAICQEDAAGGRPVGQAHLLRCCRDGWLGSQARQVCRHRGHGLAACTKRQDRQGFRKALRRPDGRTAALSD